MATKKTLSTSTHSLALATDVIEHRILIIRGQKVMLDSDLAELYGVLTKNLNKAVKRNLDRFPNDFMFQLTAEEAERLRFQIGTLKRGRGQHRKYLPYVFTEHGAVMLATILNSPVAIQASIHVVRAFVRLRSILAAHKELAKRIDALEKKTGTNFKAVFELIEKYLKPAAKPAQRIGFRADKGQ